jgi:hypothetical protein
MAKEIYIKNDGQMIMRDVREYEVTNRDYVLKYCGIEKPPVVIARGGHQWIYAQEDLGFWFVEEMNYIEMKLKVTPLELHQEVISRLLHYVEEITTPMS